MAKFLEILKEKKIMCFTRRHLVVLDGYNSHITLNVIIKAKTHSVDLITLPSHTSHELQSLNIAYFKSLNQAFRAYKNVWSIENPNGKYRKENLA